MRKGMGAQFLSDNESLQKSCGAFLSPALGIRQDSRPGENAMHAATQQIRNVCFFALMLIFALLVAFFTLGGRRIGLLFAVLVALASAFALVALMLVVLTLRVKEGGMQRISFLLVGASALGMPLAAVLHNVVYGLFIWWFGEGFWERHGMPDEPVFFFLAIMVCPALFVAGSTASIVLLIKANKKERGSQLF